MRQEERSTADANILKVGLKRLGCPIGTVPIKRVTKNDLIRAKLHSNTYGLKNDSKFGVLTLENPGTHVSFQLNFVCAMCVRDLHISAND